MTSANICQRRPDGRTAIATGRMAAAKWQHSAAYTICGQDLDCVWPSFTAFSAVGYSVHTAKFVRHVII